MKLVKICHDIFMVNALAFIPAPGVFHLADKLTLTIETTVREMCADIFKNLYR